MAKKESMEEPKKRAIFRVTKFTRRQFMKSVAVVVAGAAIASLPAACKPTGATTSATAQDSTSAAPDSTSASTGSSSTDITPPTSSSSVPITSSAYVPPTAKPPVITIAGTSCMVATDRLYSTDHIWVKQLTDNRVVVGISFSMFEILYNPWKCSLSKPGTSLAKGDNFGAIEGYKMAADLISPVSGTVLQINPLVVGIVDTADGALIDLADPYNRGWMMVIQLSKPAELNNLLTAKQYASLVANLKE